MKIKELLLGEKTNKNFFETQEGDGNRIIVL